MIFHQKFWKFSQNFLKQLCFSSKRAKNLTSGFESFLQNRWKYSVFCNFLRDFFCKFSKIFRRPGGSAPRTPYLESPPEIFSCVRHCLYGENIGNVVSDASINSSLTFSPLSMYYSVDFRRCGLLSWIPRRKAHARRKDYNGIVNALLFFLLFEYSIIFHTLCTSLQVLTLITTTCCRIYSYCRFHIILGSLMWKMFCYRLV